MTPDHPCLNDKNEWKHIKDFKVNSNDERIKCSLTGVVIDFEEDLKNCNGWSLKLDNHTFKTDTIENMFMSFSFVRTIAMLITDGHIREKNPTDIIHFGHKLDAQEFIKDFGRTTQNIIKDGPTKI